MNHIYFINLDRCKDRHKQTVQQLQIHKIKHTRISAIDGSNFPAFKNNEASAPEIACTMSHLHAIKKAYDDNRDIAFIAEDDIIYDNYAKSEKVFIQNIFQHIPINWEIIQLQCSNPTIMGKKLYPLYKIGAKFTEWKPSHWSTGIYMINRKGMSKIVSRYFSNNELILYNNNRKDKKITADYLIYNNAITYTYIPQMFPMRTDYSNIHQSHINKYHKIAMTFYKKMI